MIKLWTLLLASSLGMVFGSYAVLGRVGLLLGIAFSILLIFLVHLFGEKQILKVLKARPLQGHDPWGTDQQLRKVCNKMRVARPTLYLAPLRDPYSFALRFSGKEGVIVLSTNLLKRLARDELAVVLAYHLVHLKHQAALLCGVSTITNHSLLLLGQRLDRLWSLRAKVKQQDMRLFSPICKGFADFVSQASVLPRTHHRYDSEVSDIIGDSRLVATTLWKLHNLSENLSQHEPFCSQHLLIVNPLTISQKPPYFRSHPPVERRIQHLTGHFPL